MQENYNLNEILNGVSAEYYLDSKISELGYKNNVLEKVYNNDGTLKMTVIIDNKIK